MIKHRYMACNKTEAVVLTLIFIVFVGGYLINFQNLWEYWPTSGQLADVSLKWIISIIGVFVPPFGSITGWIF